LPSSSGRWWWRRRWWPEFVVDVTIFFVHCWSAVLAVVVEEEAVEEAS